VPCVQAAAEVKCDTAEQGDVVHADGAHEESPVEEDTAVSRSPGEFADAALDKSKDAHLTEGDDRLHKTAAGVKQEECQGSADAKGDDASSDVAYKVATEQLEKKGPSHVSFNTEQDTAENGEPTSKEGSLGTAEQIHHPTQTASFIKVLFDTMDKIGLDIETLIELLDQSEKSLTDGNPVDLDQVSQTSRTIFERVEKELEHCRSSLDGIDPEQRWRRQALPSKDGGKDSAWAPERSLIALAYERLLKRVAPNLKALESCLERMHKRENRASCECFGPFESLKAEYQEAQQAVKKETLSADEKQDAELELASVKSTMLLQLYYIQVSARTKILLELDSMLHHVSVAIRRSPNDKQTDLGQLEEKCRPLLQRLAEHVNDCGRSLNELDPERELRKQALESFDDRKNDQCASEEWLVAKSDQEFLQVLVPCVEDAQKRFEDICKPSDESLAKSPDPIEACRALEKVVLRQLQQVLPDDQKLEAEREKLEDAQVRVTSLQLCQVIDATLNSVRPDIDAIAGCVADAMKEGPNEEIIFRFGEVCGPATQSACERVNQCRASLKAVDPKGNWQKKALLALNNRDYKPCMAEQARLAQQSQVLDHRIIPLFDRVQKLLDQQAAGRAEDERTFQEQLRTLEKRELAMARQAYEQDSLKEQEGRNDQAAKLESLEARLQHELDTTVDTVQPSLEKLQKSLDSADMELQTGDRLELNKVREECDSLVRRARERIAECRTSLDAMDEAGMLKAAIESYDSGKTDIRSQEQKNLVKQSKKVFETLEPAVNEAQEHLDHLKEPRDAESAAPESEQHDAQRNQEGELDAAQIQQAEAKDKLADEAVLAEAKHDEHVQLKEAEIKEMALRLCKVIDRTISKVRPDLETVQCRLDRAEQKQEDDQAIDVEETEHDCEPLLKRAFEQIEQCRCALQTSGEHEECLNLAQELYDRSQDECTPGQRRLAEQYALLFDKLSPELEHVKGRLTKLCKGKEDAPSKETEQERAYREQLEQIEAAKAETEEAKRNLEAENLAEQQKQEELVKLAAAETKGISVKLCRVLEDTIHQVDPNLAILNDHLDSATRKLDKGKDVQVEELHEVCRPLLDRALAQLKECDAIMRGVDPEATWQDKASEAVATQGSACSPEQRRLVELLKKVREDLTRSISDAKSRLGSFEEPEAQTEPQETEQERAYKKQLEDIEAAKAEAAEAEQKRKDQEAAEQARQQEEAESEAAETKEMTLKLCRILDGSLDKLANNLTLLNEHISNAERKQRKGKDVDYEQLCEICEPIINANRAQMLECEGSLKGLDPEEAWRCKAIDGHDGNAESCSEEQHRLAEKLKAFEEMHDGIEQAKQRLYAFEEPEEPQETKKEKQLREQLEQQELEKQNREEEERRQKEEMAAEEEAKAAEEASEAEKTKEMTLSLCRIIDQAIGKIEPNLAMLADHLDAAERKQQRKEKVDEEELTRTCKPLLEKAASILQECEAAIKGLDPDGTWQAKAQAAAAGSGDKKATPEQHRLAELVTKLTGDVAKSIEHAKKRLLNFPKAKKNLSPLLVLLEQPLVQIVTGIGLLLNGVLGLVGNLLNGLGLGGIGMHAFVFAS
jgi:hypothetical protein